MDSIVYSVRALRLPKMVVKCRKVSHHYQIIQIDRVKSMGAPLDNKNATKGKPWRDAIQWALENYEKEGVVKRNMALRAIATKLVEQALDGKLDSQKELGDRIEGKPKQSIDVTHDLSESTLEDLKAELAALDA